MTWRIYLSLPLDLPVTRTEAKAETPTIKAGIETMELKGIVNTPTIKAAVIQEETYGDN